MLLVQELRDFPGLVGINGKLYGVVDYSCGSCWHLVGIVEIGWELLALLLRAVQFCWELSTRVGVRFASQDMVHSPLRVLSVICIVRVMVAKVKPPASRRCISSAKHVHRLFTTELSCMRVVNAVKCSV